VREEQAMRRALALAGTDPGAASPNPCVGAVVLDAAGALVGEGRTAPPPGPHAEVIALAAAGAAGSGGTLVVTLEPCRHTGRTPPCTDAVIAAGVSRVVYAVADPDPVAAGGAQVLRDAGVEVAAGLLAAEAAAVHESWLFAVRRGRPFVTLKLAASLDGRAAAADGTSRWITGAAARADGHLLRAGSDAVLAGVGTVLADDPQLTARDDAGHLAGRQPLRVVLDSYRRTPPAARVLDDAARTVLLSRDDVAEEAPGRLRPADVLADLHARGVRALLVEGGPRVAGSFLAAGMVDRVVAYLAPLVLGADALGCVGPAGVATLSAAPRMRVTGLRRLDDDVRIELRAGDGG
jgi:diaminohydroxyphosphoribosylaminopyrimidine deaminase/5-amino-6-(5-phosphoribosylamino)uracil reductase